MLVKFRLDEKPIPKARHRTRLCKNKVITYDPQHEEKMNTRKKIKAAISRKRVLKTCDETLHVNMCFGIQTPRSLSTKLKNTLNGQACDKRPDLDNYVKYYLDAMIGIVYTDDNIIASVFARKIYSPEPYVEIEVVKLKNLKNFRKWYNEEDFMYNEMCN